MTPRVLIIDDSLTVRMDLDEAFRSAEFLTTLCGSVAAAREELARSPFDLAVIDLLLPDGDGLEILKEIKSTTSIPAILLSTEAEVRDRVLGLKTGADEYVGKPYDASYLVARARDLVRRSRPRKAAPILVIDDSPTNRDVVARALRGAGYEVVEAATGEEGLKTAANLRPCAVVVDGHMPGIDGGTVIRLLRQDAAHRRTPCILLTGSEAAVSETRALDLGADAYVRKNEDLEVLLARLASLLRRADTPAAVEADSLLGPKRILAVDDSPTFLEHLADELQSEGYEIVAARSGEEALELLAVQSVDCILLDLLMPGLSGEETCRRIKTSPAWRDVPLMMLTALDEKDAMIQGMNAGADDYITKSGDLEVLKARLRAQIRRKQFEDENRHIREQLLRKELEATEARASRQLAETRAGLLRQLEEKNQELEAFSYSVSHDLRAPLRGIDAFTRALEEEHSAAWDESARRYLRIVRESAGKMEALIEDLLSFARMSRQMMDPAPIDMTALAREAYGEIVRTHPDRRIEFRLAELPTARGDRAMIRQVFANLLSNAVKYTGPRETAVIEVGSEDGTTYFVRDNGVGFDMQYAQKLFGIFQRLHSPQEFEGTGVGLALVERIVRRHGGRVWAEAEPGRGATFRFSLPRGTS